MTKNVTECVYIVDFIRPLNELNRSTFVQMYFVELFASVGVLTEAIQIVLLGLENTMKKFHKAKEKKEKTCNVTLKLNE